MALAAENETGAPAVPDGITVMTGSVVSCTVMVNFAVDSLPTESVAVHVTSVSSLMKLLIGKVDPEAGLQDNVGDGSTASVAVGFA